jgi:hypothetical protein
MKKSFLMVVGLLALAALLAACSQAAPAVTPVDVPPASPTLDPNQPVSPQQPGAPLAPLPQEGNMDRGSVYIDNVNILTLESFPPQFNVEVQGNLPTPCHRLRYVINEPAAQNNINIEIFTLVNPEEMCIQVLQPFDEVISLGSFPDGSYTVLVNGQAAGQIRTP